MDEFEKQNSSTFLSVFRNHRKNIYIHTVQYAVVQHTYLHLIILVQHISAKPLHKFWGANRPYLQPMAELRRTQIKHVVKSKGILKAPSAAAIRQLTSNRGSQIDLGVDFREGGKPEDPGKNPLSTGETNYNNSILT